MSTLGLGHRWRVALAALTLGLATSAFTQDDKVTDAIAAKAEQALWWGDFDTLERAYLDAEQSTVTNPYNGWSARQSVRSGIAETFKYNDLNDAYFREFELLTERWARERPQSVLAQLLYARALYARAWHIRGSGFWISVPSNARLEFTRLIAKAETHIADRSAMLLKDTSTHVYLLMIGRAAGWSPAQFNALIADALSKSHEDEDALFEEAVLSLLPKWGGSWQQVQAFIDDATRRTRERRGNELYALLWTLVVTDVDGNPFQASGARWLQVKQGLESLAAKRSHPLYANRLAYFACQAEDRDTATAWIARLHGGPEVRHWRGGGAGGRQNFEACQRWLQAKP